MKLPAETRNLGIAFWNVAVWQIDCAVFRVALHAMATELVE